MSGKLALLIDLLGNLKVPASTVGRKLKSPKLNVVRRIAPFGLRIKVGSHSLKGSPSTCPIQKPFNRRARAYGSLETALELPVLSAKLPETGVNWAHKEPASGRFLRIYGLQPHELKNWTCKGRTLTICL